MKYLKNQKGFGAFEAILIVLLLVVVGAAGYFAYQARQDKTDYSVSVSKKANKTSPQDSTINQPPVKSDEQQIKEAVAAAQPRYSVVDVEIIGSNAHGNVRSGMSAGMFWARNSGGSWRTYGIGAQDYAGTATAARFSFPTNKGCSAQALSSRNDCWYRTDYDDSAEVGSLPQP